MMVDQVLTVRCKLAPTDTQAKSIEETLVFFADACTWINQNVDPKVKGGIKMQYLIYQDARETFGLSANLTIQAIRRVASNRKTAGKNKIEEFQPTSISYDQRIFQYREADEQVGLTLLHGRERIPLDIGNYQRNLLKGQKPTSATLVKMRSGYYIDIQVKSEAPDTIETDKVIGVDLGITDLAVTSEGETYSGSEIKTVRDHFAQLRTDLQRKASKGTRSTRRRCRQLLKRLSGKEQRFQRWVNHGISKSIVQRAIETESAIALEDLSGIRQTSNRRIKSLHKWAFYQLKEFVSYKALGAGIPVILVEPAYTSKTCHQCHHIGDRNGKVFSCPSCGWGGDADYNGAKNIADLGAAVNQPGGPGLFCLIEAEKIPGLQKAPLFRGG
ncbi:RNA-guided endonuclease InsQ/TnpB family protein [Candidatus Methanocrinis natronophilus]|uniref:Transposase n=1 Tax=Candidatus Methanocrinis natronophilus TaxID=3033396 RepID=A0ABT5X723_9EURY|nr:transposase [Candidatus Methanocrinis natronophilus]MDF0590367.1 transposase [Candidatus Methanocrinis natronophilus]